MMVVCSFSALVRAALFLVALALVVGLALARPSEPSSAPGSGHAVSTTQVDAAGR